MSFQDDNPPPTKRRLAIPVAIALIITLVVVLHLAGVFGPGSH